LGESNLPKSIAQASHELAHGENQFQEKKRRRGKMANHSWKKEI